MILYGLKIDSVNSGFEAIENVKSGNIYDIIFMDHMMPKMDGIEATKIIRDMGYKHSVIALTANAVAGQADVFLKNGFDDFISKPIDVRQLNNLLNKYIRDKQPPEVIEEARRQAEAKKEQAQAPADTSQQPAIDPQFAEIFIRDASKSLAALEAIIERASYNDEDMRAYVIHTHGMKSALANIGKMNLSAIALKLEQMGRDENTEVIVSETPGFLSSLRAYVEELKPKEADEDGKAVDEDKDYLYKKLLAVKAACGEYDESTAEKTIAELRKATWSGPTKELLGTIAELLLHSDFDEIVNEVKVFLKMNGK
jgi:CheY-like chemotaxis protein/HPt (histidine-containing phosphotransfer) domain-containing protein